MAQEPTPPEPVATEDEKDKRIAEQAAEIEDWKEKLQAAKAESIDRRKQLDLWKKLGKSPDEVQEKLSAAIKGSNPDHEQIVTQIRAEHEAALGELQKALATERRNNITDRLKTELATAGFVPEALDTIAATAARDIEHDDDGTFKIMAGGKPMVGKGPNGGATLTDYAAQLAKVHTYALADQGKGGSGKQPGSNGGTPDGKTVTRSAWDGMSHLQRANFSKSGGKVVND